MIVSRTSIGVIWGLLLIVISKFAQAETPELIISNATLISAERARPLKNAWVRIQGDRIIEVSTQVLKLERAGRMINAAGQYLIPGLMDSHVHLSRMPGLPFENGTPAPHLAHLQKAYQQQQPRSYLYFGVTQLVDLAASPKSVARFEANLTRPDLFHCGAMPILGGYPAVLTKHTEHAMAMFPYFIDQETVGDAPRVVSRVDLSRHTPEVAVERMHQGGAICAKVHLEDGFDADRGWPMLSKENILRVKKAASALGMPVLAHANAIDMQLIAEELGVDVIAHGMWNWIQLHGQPGLPSEIKALLDRIIAKGIAFQPTFGVMEGLRDTVAGKDIHGGLYVKSTPKALRDWYATAEGQWFRHELIRGFGGAPLETILGRQSQNITQGERVAKYLADNGGTLLLASDTPSSPVYVSQPGYNSYLELQYMARAGIDLQTIFEAATLNNARVFGLDADYGTIEPGKIANLLLLKENPLQSIEAYHTISQIVLHGEVIEREHLSAERLPGDKTSGKVNPAIEAVVKSYVERNYEFLNTHE